MQKRMSATDAGSESSLRVRTDRLDRLIDMVGELVIAQSMVTQDGTIHQTGNHELLKKVTHAGKIVRELQDLTMSMRMVPLKTAFQKMARLARDLAHKNNRIVNFIAEGEDTEIDRNMVDVISDPLVHMVRNAIDHGLEPPEVRTAAGKSAEGRLRLSAYHSGGDVVVELEDDGKGLNRSKIVEKAIAKGLIEAERSMSDSEVFDLIFAPGFSTADKITDISGRGVGMDVVKRSVEALRGRIEIASESGQGTTFTIRLPLTLAITDGMLVKVGSERYIIPTVNIKLSFRPDGDSLSKVAGRGEMVMLRGDLMPLFRLHRLFRITGAVEEPTRGLLVMVGDGNRRCVLLVDELLGQQQVVAKTLGDGLGKIQGVSGGAILGDGRVGLILDPSEIVALARQGGGSEDQSAA
jgi:two-component system, chemotaxis family, sensor kinase CheA